MSHYDDLLAAESASKLASSIVSWCLTVNVDDKGHSSTSRR